MKKGLILSIVYIFSTFSPFITVCAQENHHRIDYLQNLSLEDLMDVDVNIGSRGKARPQSKSLVPIEIISAQDIARTGYGELGKILEVLLPAFNFPRAYITDGTDSARPFTLRGMGADQVLVLINGKRRHSSALLHTNAAVGRGSTSVDINMIPIQAIDRIEILNDGAAAQYGSDAIAGIINIVLKQSIENEIKINIGQTNEGDGALGQIGFSKGYEFAEKQGFLHISGEARKRNASNRSGLDTRTQYFSGDPRNANAPTITHSVGDAALQDFAFIANGDFIGGYGVQYYMQGSLGQRLGTSVGFFRRPLDTRNVRAIYPDGFLPQITSTIRDMGLSLGAKSKTQNDWQWDLSYTFGLSEFQFGVENSLNASLGTASPTSFDSGTLKSSQHLFNLDAFKAMDVGLENKLNVGIGAELRFERYAITAGELASYVYGGVPVLDGPSAGATTVAGAQVFPGFQPNNATDEQRYNASLYLDLEYPITASLSTQAAVRYEHYSDFGSTLNGKLATVYNVDEQWSVRASASTGFRAPSLAQSHYTSTTTGFVNSIPVELGTFSVTHPLAQALGATDLKAETSKQFNTGLSYKPSKNFIFSADYFFTRIDDRIVLSSNIVQDANIYGQTVVDILQSYNVSGARFFTNAIDTETQGIDLSAKYEMNLPIGRLNLKAQYALSKTNLIGAVRAPAILGKNGADVILSRTERTRIEDGQPEDNLILTAVYDYKKLSTTLRLQRYGRLKIVNYLAAPEYDQVLTAKWLTDLDFTYRYSNNLEFGLGVHNLFDVYPDTSLGMASDAFIGADKITPYSTSVPFIDGAFYYAKMQYRF